MRIEGEGWRCLGTRLGDGMRRGNEVYVVSCCGNEVKLSSW